MRRLLIILASLFLVTVFIAPSASAASPHFKEGGSPTCTVVTSATSASTTCTATLAGLGGGDLYIELTTAGSAVYQCQNPGGNLAPGQNRVLIGPVTEPTTIDGDEIKNGNLRFTTDPAVLTADDEVTGAEAGCPNGKWSGVNPTLLLTNVTLDISQGGPLFHCTASDPNGLTGTFALTC